MNLKGEAILQGTGGGISWGSEDAVPTPTPTKAVRSGWAEMVLVHLCRGH